MNEQRAEEEVVITPETIVADEVLPPDPSGLSAEAEFAQALGIEMPTEEVSDDEKPPVTGEETGAPGPATPTEEPADGGVDPDPEFDNLPETNPHPDHWKTVRERDKAYRRQIKELKAQLSAAPQASAASDATDPETTEAGEVPLRYVPKPDDKPAPKYDPKWLFKQYARAINGEVDSSVQQEAEQHIYQHMSADELCNVVIAARKGELGEASEQIDELATKWLPVVLSGEQVRQREEQQARAAEVVRSRSWQNVVSQLPDIGKEGTQLRTAFEGSWRELESVFPTLGETPTAPEIVAEFMHMKANAMRAKELAGTVTAKDAEIADLKRRLGIAGAPAGVRRTAGTGAARGAATAEDQLANELREHGLNV